MADTLTIKDNRTGKTYEVPIQYGTYPEYGAAINALDLRKVKASENDFGLLAYDPGYSNTASCKSAVTFIDGEKGILRYRGFPIEELAQNASFLKVAYLLLNGDLPTKEELDNWTYQITHHTMLHENVKKFMDGFRYDAHPMGILISTVAAMATFYPEARTIDNEETRKLQIYRLIAKMPTIAGFAYRHSLGFPYVYPDNRLTYAGNLLNMMFNMGQSHYGACMVMDGDDLLLLMRTSDAEAENAHNSNLITFHKLSNFRELAY